MKKRRKKVKKAEMTLDDWTGTVDEQEAKNIEERIKRVSFRRKLVGETKAILIRIPMKEHLLFRAISRVRGVTLQDWVYGLLRKGAKEELEISTVKEKIDEIFRV